MHDSRSSDPPLQIAGWQLTRPLGDVDRDGVARYVGITSGPSLGPAHASEHWSNHTARRVPDHYRRAIVHLARSERAVSALSHEASVRMRLAGDFIDPFEDLVRTESGTIAVQPWSEQQRYADLVRSGTQLSPGQFVTLAAPVVECVVRAIDQQVIPISLGLASCTINRRGVPSVHCWRGAVLTADVTRMRADVLRQQCVRQLATLVDALGALIDQGPAHSVRAQISRLSNGGMNREELLLLLELLYGWTAPEPVDAASLHAGEDGRPSSGHPATRHPSAPVSREGSTGTAVEPAFQLPAPQPAASEPHLDDAPLLEPASRSPSSKRGASARLDRMVLAAQSVRAEIWLALAGAGAFVTVSGALLG